MNKKLKSKVTLLIKNINYIFLNLSDEVRIMQKIILILDFNTEIFQDMKWKSERYNQKINVYHI
jgi:hypothetical protein